MAGFSSSPLKAQDCGQVQEKAPGPQMKQHSVVVDFWLRNFRMVLVTYLVILEPEWAFQELIKYNRT